MFTGIIESMAQVVDIERDAGNIHIRFATPLAKELKVDQSVSHNGVCMTVIEKTPDYYTVTAIQETLLRTNLETLQLGDWVNLERCMVVGSRLDGHIVQGHVDTVGVCVRIVEADGSWYYRFEHAAGSDFLTVPKGSIAVNGVSLTVVESWAEGFSVAIIPYTYEHTNFKYLQQGSIINLEFDIIGKYIAKQIHAYK